MNAPKITGWTARMDTPVYTLLRVVAGALLASHGAQKLFGVMAAKAQPALGSQLWVGGVIELVAGTLIAIGLLTRPAAFLASGTMAVAYLQFHWKFRFDDAMWSPLVNRGELALVYALLFLFFVVRGAGALSLDAWLARRRAYSRIDDPYTGTPFSRQHLGSRPA